MLQIKLRQIRTKSALAIFIPFTVLMTGCDRDALFEQVQRFSASAEQLEKQFPDLATDVYDSCLRTAEYTLIQASDEPFKNRINSQEKCIEPLVFDNEGLEVTVTKQEFEGELIAVNDVIVNYLQALGTVASNGEISYTENVQGLGNAIARVEPRLTEAENQAGQKILEFILGAYNNEFRQETLATEITVTNEPLQRYICLLKQDIVGQYLDAELQTEKEAVDEYYQAYINRELEIDRTQQNQQYLIQQYLHQELELEPLPEPTLATKPPFAVLKLDSQWRETRAKVQQREAAANNYIDVLNTIAGGHSQLDRQLGGSGKGQAELCPDEAKGSLVYKDFPPVMTDESNESDPVEIATKYADRLELLVAKENN